MAEQPELRRLVEVKGATEGSGYLIAPSLILTAWHVVARDDGEVTEIQVSILGECLSDGVLNTKLRRARLIWPTLGADRRVDLALIATTEPTETVQPVEYTVLPTRQVDVRAIGFPDIGIFSVKDGAEFVFERDTVPVNGWVDGAMGVKQLQAIHSGTLEIRMKYEDQLASSKTGWRGMSGAALFAGPQLVGVVTVASEKQQNQKILAVPVAPLFALPDVRAAIVAGPFETPRLASGRSELRPEDLLDELHYLDRDAVAKNLYVALDDWVCSPKEPLLLTLHCRSDDDLPLLFQRFTEKELQEYGEEFLIKEVPWIDSGATLDGGKKLILRDLKKALVGDPKQQQLELPPERVRDLVPPGRVLFIFSRVKMGTFERDPIQPTLLDWWREYWLKVAETGVGVVVLVAFEDVEPPAECCRNLSRRCVGLELRQTRPAPAAPARFSSIGPMTCVDFDHVDTWLGRLAEKSRWREIRPISDGALVTKFARPPVLPRGLRCVRLALPRLLAEDPA